jgi:hypothetical protein
MYLSPKIKDNNAQKRIRLSNKASIKTSLAKISSTVTKATSDSVKYDKGDKATTKNVVNIKAINIKGLIINSITSGIAIFLGRRSSPLIISFKHLIQRPIN